MLEGVSEKDRGPRRGHTWHGQTSRTSRCVARDTRRGGDRRRQASLREPRRRRGVYRIDEYTMLLSQRRGARRKRATRAR